MENLINIIKKHAVKIFFAFVFTSMLSYLVVICWFVPMIDEDFTLYARGEDLYEIIKMCANQYLTWNARIGDILSILFSTLPGKLFQVLNGLLIGMFIIGILYVSKIVSLKKKIYKIDPVDITGSVVIFLSILFFTAQPNEVFFWRTGAANYFYPVLFTLIFSIPVLLLLIKNKDVFSMISSPVVRILVKSLYISSGLIIGHSNENIAPVISMLLLLSVAHRYWFSRKVEWWLLLCLLTVTIGTCLLLFGPSTQYRIEYYTAINAGAGSYFDNFLHNFKNTLSTYLHYAYLPSAIVLILTIMMERGNRTVALRILIASLLVSLASVGILTLSPYEIPRAYFFATIVLIVPVISSIYLVKNNGHKILISTTIILLALAAPLLASELKNIVTFGNEKKAAITEVEISLSKKGSAAMPDFSNLSSRFVYVGVPSFETQRISKFYGYGKDSVKLSIPN